MREYHPVIKELFQKGIITLDQADKLQDAFEDYGSEKYDEGFKSGFSACEYE